MTQSLDTPPNPGDGSSSTTDVAKDEARSVGQSTADAGKQVAGTAAEQAQQVTQETRRQAQDLLAQGRSQATEQARNGQQKAAGSLSALAEELRTLTDGEGGSGPAHDLVRQATDAVDGLAGHLRDREPADLLADVRSFARRRPGLFLLGAAVAGVVAGRLTTGVVAAHKDEGSAPHPAPCPVAAHSPARTHCQARRCRGRLRSRPAGHRGRRLRRGGPLLPVGRVPQPDPVHPALPVRAARPLRAARRPVAPTGTGGPGYDPTTGYTPVPPAPYGTPPPVDPGTDPDNPFGGRP